MPRSRAKHQIAAGGEDGSAGKRVSDSVEAELGQVERRGGGCIGQLDEGRVGGQRVVTGSLFSVTKSSALGISPVLLTVMESEYPLSGLPKRSRPVI